MFNVSKFQKNDPKDWVGLTTENHLSQLYMRYPELISKVVENIYRMDSSDSYGMFSQFPTKYLKEDKEYEWGLMGMEEKAVQLKAAYMDEQKQIAITSTDRPGEYDNHFYLEFEEDYFDSHMMIASEKKDLYEYAVMKKIHAGFYEVKLNDDDKTKFVDPALLVAGKEFHRAGGWSPQTLSSEGFEPHHTSPFRMITWMQQMRMRTVVPGNMIDAGANNPLAFNFKVGNKTTDAWINKLDYDFEKQFNKLWYRMLLTGRSNRLADGTYSMKGESGYEVRKSPGLRQQIAPSNIQYYNDFDIDVFTKFVLDQLCVNKLPTDKREFTIFMGEHGIVEFSKAVENAKSALNSIYPIERANVGKGGVDGTYIHPEYKQVWEIRGIRYNIVHEPCYDEVISNPKLSSKGGRAESHRMTILDFGTSSGESNIYKLAPEKDEVVNTYIPGLRHPFKPSGEKISLAASEIDGYVINKMRKGGIMIKNPLSCAEYIPEELLD